MNKLLKQLAKDLNPEIIEDISFEEKYGIPLKLAMAAPKMLKVLKRVNHTLVCHGHIDADTDLHLFVDEAIKNATL